MPLNRYKVLRFITSDYLDIYTIENEGNLNMNSFNNKIYDLNDFYSTINCIHFVEFLGGDT